MTFTAETHLWGQNKGYNTSSVNADRFCGALNDLVLKVLETPTDQRATNIFGPIIFLATRKRIEILICSCLLHNAIAKLFFVWGPDVLSPISRYQACIMPTITRFICSLTEGNNCIARCLYYYSCFRTFFFTNITSPPTNQSILIFIDAKRSFL